MNRQYQNRSFLNLNKMRFVGVGQYDIPQIQAEPYVNCRWVSFNYALSAPVDTRAATGVHFFVDDYQFARAWQQPDTYTELFRQFHAVCAPDFSLFADMPLTLQIFNHYRKHWLAAYWQLNGIPVVPTIAWSTPDSYIWCFDGEPTHTTVAVSSVGCMKHPSGRKLFVAGYREMVARLQPAQVLFMGKIPDEVAALAPTIQMVNFTERFKGGD